MDRVPLQNFFFLLLFFAIASGPVYGQSLKESMNDAAESLVKTAVNIEPGDELHILEIVNLHSSKHDQIGKKIETEIYFALERQFPDFKLFLGKDGNKDRSIFLTGTYEKKGEQITVRLRVARGEEILAQVESLYTAEKRRKTLVAVLDIDAETLNKVQRRAFSNIFRSALIEKQVFDIASSADVDKMDPDEIQKATGCSRDECATVIGEQLGVDRSISTSFSKISDGMYILSSKVIDIKNGSILKSKTLTHNGTLQELPVALEKLAFLLTADLISLRPDSIDSDVPLAPVEEIKSADSGWPWWYWAIGGAILAGAAVAASAGDDEPEEDDNTGSITASWE